LAPEMSDIEPTVPGWPTTPGPVGDAPDELEAPDAPGARASSPWAALFGGGRGATAVISLVAALIAVLVVALVAAHEASGYFLFSPATRCTA
jgi:hypothetical protein